MHRSAKISGFSVGMLIILASFASIAADSVADRKAKLAELDAACEVARLEKLVPLRKQYSEDCVAKGERPDQESCERYYADYGNGAGNRRLFYDLPACVTAFEYFKSGD